MVRLTKGRRKAYRQQYYQANKSEALNSINSIQTIGKRPISIGTDRKLNITKNYYAKNADEIRFALRKLYASNSPPSISVLPPPRRPPELRYCLQRPPAPLRLPSEPRALPPPSHTPVPALQSARHPLSSAT